MDESMDECMSWSGVEWNGVELNETEHGDERKESFDGGRAE